MAGHPVRLPTAPSAYDVSNESQARLMIEVADNENMKFGKDVELARGELLILRSPSGSR